MLGNKATSSFPALVGISALASFLLASNPANAAIYINKQSKVIILSGYSLDLTKQEVPQPLRPRLDAILQGLGRGLELMFDAKAEFFSERKLNWRLDLQKIPKGNTAEALKTLFEREGYTHLVVADIETADGNVGSAFVQVAKLDEKGSVTERDPTPPDINLDPARIDSELSSALFDFRKKFRADDAPKLVKILCIRPRSPVVRDHTPQTELESILSKPITMELIGFYNSQKMKAKGYRPLVNDLTYDFYKDEAQTMKCKLAAPADSYDTVTKVSVSVPDYVVAGEVGVIGKQSEVDSIELTIKVIHKLRSEDCWETIPISHDFDRTNYNGNKKTELSFMFSERILRKRYETWMDDFESNTSCKCCK
jgi:hypothetical protein